MRVLPRWGVGVQEEEQEEVLDKHIFRWDTAKCVEKYKPASFRRRSRRRCLISTSFGGIQPNVWRSTSLPRFTLLACWCCMGWRWGRVGRIQGGSFVQKAEETSASATEGRRGRLVL